MENIQDFWQMLSPAIMPIVALGILLVQAIGGFFWLKSRTDGHNQTVSDLKEDIGDLKAEVTAIGDRLKAIELTRPDKLEELFNDQTNALRDSIKRLADSFDQRTRRLEDHFIDHIRENHKQH